MTRRSRSFWSRGVGAWGRGGFSRGAFGNFGIASPGVVPSILLMLGFPVEVGNPVQRKPIIVYGLLIWLSMMFLSQVLLSLALDTKRREEMWRYLFLVPTDIVVGRHLWTLVTSGFFHLGLWHLLGNLYFLYTFGDNVEDRLGRRSFLVLYFVSEVVANLLHVAFNVGESLPTLGASGAVSGVMGAYLVLYPRVKFSVLLFYVPFQVRTIWYLGIWAAWQVLQALLKAPGVAWYAHAGGFAAGLVMAGVARRSPATRPDSGAPARSRS